MSKLAKEIESLVAGGMDRDEAAMVVIRDAIRDAIR